jgi:hypothetical protein
MLLANYFPPKNVAETCDNIESDFSVNAKMLSSPTASGEAVTTRHF